jgi:hypothetical protein
MASAIAIPELLEVSGHRCHELFGHELDQVLRLDGSEVLIDFIIRAFESLTDFKKFKQLRQPIDRIVEKSSEHQYVRLIAALSSNSALRMYWGRDTLARDIAAASTSQQIAAAAEQWLRLCEFFHSDGNTTTAKLLAQKLAEASNGVTVPSWLNDDNAGSSTLQSPE